MDRNFYPLTHEDEELYKEHATGIEKKVRETFPSIPSDFVLKPVTVSKIPACGTMYYFMIALPNGEFAKVRFNVGGLQMLPPGGKVEKHYGVDETSFSSEYPTD